MVYEKAYKLLYYIVKMFYKNFRRSPSKTELIKMLYLTDLEYYRTFGEKYSELNYIYYHHGPWTKQYEQLLRYMIGNEIVESQQTSTDGKQYFLYFLTNNPPRHNIDIDDDVSVILNNNLFIYKESDLSQILAVVYKNEPMISAKRNELIDFSKVPINARNNRSRYRIRTKKQLKRINKINNNMRHEDEDMGLYNELKPYRKRANELL